MMILFLTEMVFTDCTLTSPLVGVEGAGAWVRGPGNQSRWSDLGRQ